MALLPALVAPALVLVHPPADELRRAAVVGGDGGREAALVEELSVHRLGGAAGVGAGDEEDKGDAFAAAGGPVLEDGDLGHLAEGGEDGEQVGVGQGVVEVGDVHRRLRRGQATAAPAPAAGNRGGGRGRGDGVSGEEGVVVV